MDFNSAEMDLTEVARGEPALTPLKATESKSMNMNIYLDKVAMS